MYIPKRYGESKIEGCPFCGMQSTTTNSQGVPVCQTHKNSELIDMKCICGEYLDIKKGKFGMFFTCMNCGPISMKKALEMNDVRDKNVNKVKSEQQAVLKGEIIKKPVRARQVSKVIETTTDDPLYFD